ncbi:hypothetical protein PTKIN_Ptkin01aG0241300 [Pterospermum kingtungense]
MGSNQRHPVEVRVSIPENENSEQSSFMTEQKKKFKLASLEAQKQASESSSKAKPLIQSVPSALIDMKQDFSKCFEPRLVALGPLHHRNRNLEPAEHSKLKLAALFALENEKTEDFLFQKIKLEIISLKECYYPKAIEGYDDEELAWMFFVDGSAVLYTVHHYIREDIKLNIKADLLALAQVDLFLLENQLPYRVLQILIFLTKDPVFWEASVAEFIGKNLITNVERGKKSRDSTSKKDGTDYAHLLHWLREQHLMGNEQKRSSSMIGKLLLKLGDSRRHRKTFRSIKELKESGIYVVPSKTNNLRNIHFDCNFFGRLRMPRLLVDDATASRFINLIALEMCPDFENDFGVTSYLCFLDTLIDKAEDVKELRATGMLHNYLGSDEEVADLFNRICGELVPDMNMYKEVTENIHKYCNNQWTTTVAQGYYTHFSSPWTFLAFLGAIIGLALSAIQTYTSLADNK